MGSRPLCSLAACSRVSASMSTYVPGIKLSGAHPGSWFSQRGSLGALRQRPSGKEHNVLREISSAILIASKRMYQVRHSSSPMLSGSSQAVLGQAGRGDRSHPAHCLLEPQATMLSDSILLSGPNVHCILQLDCVASAILYGVPRCPGILGL